ncbi:hypothetical protein HIDPHFAB_02968 [Nocardioides sp. T2.26MG-1]|nr:hypothetical protein HIDPHFAB_02968 [Nocardioides sp. T2.26MG-1]
MSTARTLYCALLNTLLVWATAIALTGPIWATP